MLLLFFMVCGGIYPAVVTSLDTPAHQKTVDERLHRLHAAGMNGPVAVDLAERQEDSGAHQGSTSWRSTWRWMHWRDEVFQFSRESSRHPGSGDNGRPDATGAAVSIEYMG
jgi:hypothetical protein